VKGKIIAHWDPGRRFASLALSLGLLLTGSSGAIFAQADGGNKRREAHKGRPEKERDTRKRRRGNGLSSSKARAESKREPQTLNRAFETERDGQKRYLEWRHLEWRHDDRKRDAESGREARKRYEETKREAVKRKRGWIREENAKQSLFPRLPERRERERFPILPKNTKQSLFLQRPETFKRKREWIKEARKLR